MNKCKHEQDGEHRGPLQPSRGGKGGKFDGDGGC